MFKFGQYFPKLAGSSISVNSSWGIISQVSQSFFLSLFFILIARNYSTQVFAEFSIATVLYQLIAAFSTLGLSQWFIRELTGTDDKNELVNKFFKLQIYTGVVFYFVNLVLVFFLYDNKLIHFLAVILGINILFDNLINAIKCITISELNQKKSSVILLIDSVLKFAITCLLFVYPMSIITLSIILVVVRLATLNLFLSMGSASMINIKLLLQYKISVKFVKELIVLNWPFIIIGSISIVNWRVSTIIISKVLTSVDVANYEIAYRIFSIASMLPIVVSSSVFPVLIKYYKEGKFKEFNAVYRKMHLYYFLFGLVTFTFIFSYGNLIIPAVFGYNYAGASETAIQMFLTILVFPTAFLQANVLVAMKCEKLDMWFNIISLLTYFVFCLVGLYFFKSLTIINLAIFSGFLLFHILQDIMLVKRKVSTGRQVFVFYSLSIVLVGSYLLIDKVVNPYVLFPVFWLAIFCFLIGISRRRGFDKSMVFSKSGV